MVLFMPKHHPSPSVDPQLIHRLMPKSRLSNVDSDQFLTFWLDDLSVTWLENDNLENLGPPERMSSSLTSAPIYFRFRNGLEISSLTPALFMDLLWGNFALEWIKFIEMTPYFCLHNQLHGSDVPCINFADIIIIVGASFMWRRLWWWWWW